MPDLSTLTSFNTPIPSSDARVLPQWGEWIWERDSYGEIEKTVDAEQSQESVIVEKHPYGTIVFNEIGSVTGKVVEAAGDIFHDAPEAIFDLFGQMIGKESHKTNGQAPDKEQQDAEHSRFSYRSQEDDRNKNAINKMKDLMAAALRMSDHTMTLTEVTQEFNPNQTVPTETPDLGINQIAFTYERIVERRAQAKKAQDQNSLATVSPTGPNYFMQQNMAGERSGGMHVLNAAG